MLGLHLKTARQHFGVSIREAVELPGLSTDVDEEVASLHKFNFIGHVLFGPLVEANCFQVEEVAVGVRLAHSRTDLIYQNGLRFRFH